ncbi:hypothetical protein HYE67_004773 [Fusarium culmorum]|uniref:Uncharacterized protein n=1 Tax=Fusarium culmorum TaxID=5516 RepID=A0A2T4H019_FUSCU|nr:hypothetical protein FCULG_00010839 [Fusarium culmorum]QPC62542.1 hypothetical protein HYE67_004773 [Fusarium culmorum]
MDMGMGMGIERLDPDGENGGATGTGRSGAQAQAPTTNDKPALDHGHDRLEKNVGISTHQLAKDIHTATTHLQGCAYRWVPSPTAQPGAVLLRLRLMNDDETLAADDIQGWALKTRVVKQGFESSQGPDG